VDVPTDLPPVLGDASQLERVIANLVENAAKFSPAGTTIRITGSQRVGNLNLRVEDEGPGVPADQLERIFEKFYRGRHGEVSVPGTGLGLSICRRIVEAHGGRIRAERSEHGARFVIELPMSVRVVGVHRAEPLTSV
jgi:two-component system sensor histidine kinase KdpD